MLIAMRSIPWPAKNGGGFDGRVFLKATLNDNPIIKFLNICFLQGTSFS